MRAFNPERQLHRIEEAFGGAMTRLTEFRLLPACGIGNLGWTTNQTCSAPPVDGSEQAPAFTREVVDLPVSCIREHTPTQSVGASTQETALGASRPSCRFPSPGNGQSSPYLILLHLLQGGHPLLWNEAQLHCFWPEMICLWHSPCVE
jgi:hypothetical protein